MTTDFGVRARRRGLPVGRIIAVFWIVALLGAAGGKFYLDRQAAIKNAQAWVSLRASMPRRADAAR